VKKLLFLVLAACGSPHAAAPPTDAAPVRTPSDAAAPDAADRGFIGVISAAESVDVAPPFDGVLATVKVRAGDAVAAGEVVAEMDPAPLQDELRTATAALASASASYRQAEVDVEDAQHKYKIEQAGFAAGTSPQSNVEAAKLAIARAKAAASQASSAIDAERARLQTAKDRLAKTQLRAPFAGTIGLRMKDPGSTIGAGVPVVRIVGQGHLRLRFAVPPERASSLVAGATVRATIDTVATPVPATIRQVSPTIDPASSMVIVEAELSPDATAAAGLRPGLAAWVSQP